MLGLLGGFLLGLLRGRRDKRVRTLDAVAQSGLPILATLPGGLPHDAFLASDARALPSVLQLCNVIAANITDVTRRLTIVGIDTDPSQVVTNLGIGLTDMGWSVALVGAGDDWRRATDRLAPGRRGPDLTRVLQRHEPVSSSLFEADHHPGLWVVANRPGPALTLEHAGPAAVKNLIDELRGDVDLVIVSIAADDENGGVGAQMLASVTDVTVAVAEVRRSRREGLTEMVDRASRVGVGLRGVIAVAAQSRRQRGQADASSDSPAIIQGAAGLSPARADRPFDASDDMLVAHRNAGASQRRHDL
jgi:hypothetical protein